MGRPRVNKSLPDYVTAFRDRHGKTRYRFRRKGFKAHYFENTPGTDAFWQEYLAVKDASAPIVAGEDRPKPGSFDDLISRYYRSSYWTGIRSETTRTVYRGQIERFRATYGPRQVSGMTALMVTNLMGLMAKTPSAASNLKKRLSQLFDFAILIGWRKDNPTKAVKLKRVKSKGYHTWSEDEISAFEERWPIGTRERLALALLLYTAQRRSDVVRMGPQHVKDGRIRVRQQKTDIELEIPMHPRLREAILAAPSGQLAYLVTYVGRPFTVSSFGNWFRKACRAAGLEKCSPHGLRKAAARRMAELGLPYQMIKAITGHVTDSEVTRYTKAADQVGMADKAMARMVKAGKSNRGKTAKSNLSQDIENAQ